MKRFVFVLSLLLFIGFNLLQGQGVQVTGTVTGADDGAALPGVSIVVQGTTIGAVTDFEGFQAKAEEEEWPAAFANMTEQDWIDAGKPETFDVNDYPRKSKFNPETVPTSDLVGAGGDSEDKVAYHTPDGWQFPKVGDYISFEKDVLATELRYGSLPAGTYQVRSEEHTSELQSR